MMKWEQIDLRRYRDSMQAGLSAEQLLVGALDDGVGEINAIRLIRELFGLDIVQAKELLVRVKTGTQTLSEHQAGLLPALQEAFASAEGEKKDDPTGWYLCEVSQRLHMVVPSGLSVPLGIALLFLLSAHSIEYDDGFIINDLTDINRTIGDIEAATIVAALDDGGRSPDWWNSLRSSQASPQDKPVYDDLLARIRTSPGVVRVA